MSYLRVLSPGQRRQRNVTTLRRVEVGTFDLDAQRLAAQWLRRQVAKDIERLIMSDADRAEVTVEYRLRLMKAVSVSYVECWGVIGPG